MQLHDGLPVAAWALAHAAGIAIALLSRLPFSGRIQQATRLALPIGLIVVAAIALSADLTGSLAWVVSAATLGLMVVASVWEPIHEPHDPMLLRLIAANE